ncbi:hypothetical protein Rhopal_006124-T1 [Rhodotorula paludigena]|uniref:RNA polymerase II assembly factor Rtp1 C-terminal domain-containing protein n=1 Tax=Rhodotorula paludigena TaxID=86838 RepID=A0AAV5GV32_9BASI|nr:hypothetical protein Rhopal_006124-T1 [Rhodotorula paludigena]
MASTPQGELRAALSSASVLLGIGQPAPRLSAKPSLSLVLAARLDAYSALSRPASSDEGTAHARPGERSYRTLDEPALQLATASAALESLERIASLVPSLSPAAFASSSAAPSTSSSPVHAVAPPPPVFGARDIKVVAQLAGIVGRWGIGSTLSPSPSPPGPNATQQQQPRLVEISPEDEERDRTRAQRLAATVRRVVRLLRLEGRADAPVMGRTDGEKHLLGLAMPQLLAPLVGALVQLVDGEEGQAAWAESALERIFRINTAPVVLSTLLGLLGSARPSWPTRSRLTSLLSTQLVRPGGVRSVFLVVIGTGAASGGEDEVSVQKLEMVRRVLETPPATGNAQAYMSNIVGQLLDILRSAASSALSASIQQHTPTPSSSDKGKSRDVPPSPTPPASIVPVPILRAASYVVAHLLVQPASSSARAALLAQLHGPLLPLSYPLIAPYHTSSNRTMLTTRALAEHLTLLSLLTLYSPPLPSLLRTLLSPLLPALFALLAFVARPRLISAASGASTAPRRVAEDEARAVLAALAKGEEDATAVVRDVAGAMERWERGEEFGRVPRGDEVADGEATSRVKWAWEEDGDGVELRCIDGQDDAAPESLFPAAAAEEDAGANAALALRVEPEWLVSWLKDVGRQELSAGLFLRWLDEIKVLRGVEDVEGAKRSVVRLQLVLQMVEHLGSDILSDPKEIIAFVAHALDAETSEPSADGDAKGGLGGGMAGLRVGGEEEREKDEAEEAEFGLGTGLGKDEMAMTALTLLLAVLEANETLDASNTPLLAVIYSQLDTLQASNTSQLIPPLAREAKMVLSLRRASSVFGAPNPDEASESSDPLAASRIKYRDALKLLQDPLLPVRAQGLHLLRTLVLDRDTALLSTDPALLPAVLDIFVGAIEEEDSFLYLNAVQGLSSLVDVFGRQVVARLAEVYTGTRRGEKGGPKEVGEGERGLRELDKRLRVGETLVQVVQRAGQALAVLVDDLLSPLLAVLRASTLPIPLRASSITILASCIETAPAAMMPHAELLTEACVTLLQVESVPLAPRARQTASSVCAPSEKAKGKGKPPVLIQEVGSDDSSESGLSDEDDEDTSRSTLGPDGRPRRPEELPDPTTTSSKHPSLRRAAAIFLGALVRIVAQQAAEQAERRDRARFEYDERDPLALGANGSGGRIRMPFDTLRTGARGDFLLRERPAGAGLGALVGGEQLVRARVVLRYVSETDEDALVREQTAQVLRELDEA